MNAIGVSIRLLYCALLAQALAPFALADVPPPKVGAGDSDRLIRSVLAGFDARDRQLQNVQFHVEGLITNTNLTDNSRVFMYRTSHDVRRLDGTVWTLCTEYSQGSKTKLRHVMTESWNGQLKRDLSFPPYSDAPFPQASIQRQNPSGLITENRFNEVLGIVMQGPTSTADGWPAAPRWLRAASTRGATISASKKTQSGRELIELEVRRGNQEHQLLIDPARNFAIIRHDYRHGNAARFIQSSEEVTSGSLIDGVWVPTKAVRHALVFPGDVESEFTYEATNWRMGQLKPIDVSLPFPEGTKVYDQVRDVVYFVKPVG